VESVTVSWFLLVQRILIIGFVTTAFQTFNPLMAGDETTPTQPAQDVVYDLGPGITKPHVIKQVAPTFTGVNFRRDGTVTVSLVVSAEGIPEKVTVTHGLDDRTDKSAIDAVKEWRFSPAKKGSQPVAVRLTIELRFHDV
jgi:TonB family protein